MNQQKHYINKRFVTWYFHNQGLFGMITMANASENTPSVTREAVLALIERKDQIESEIFAQKEILRANNIGMTEPLVDHEGYPRQDIDVYQVRHARHRVICLQNDHKDLMKQIERGIHTIHSFGPTALGPAIPSVKKSTKETEPIATVTKVEVGSPAQEAGLQEADQILSFGTVNSENMRSLLDIQSVVQHSVNRPITVEVLRQGNILRLELTPHRWSGRGLLGVFFLESVDR